MIPSGGSFTPQFWICLTCCTAPSLLLIFFITLQSCLVKNKVLQIFWTDMKWYPVSWNSAQSHSLYIYTQNWGWNRVYLMKLGPKDKMSLVEAFWTDMNWYPVSWNGTQSHSLYRYTQNWGWNRVYLIKLGPKDSMSLGGNSNNIYVSLGEGGDEDHNFERVQHLQRTIRLLCLSLIWQ